MYRLRVLLTLGKRLTTLFFNISVGEYSYARWTVAALERVQETQYNDIFPITFSGRDTALEMDDVIETLRDLMDIAFKSVMGIEDYDDDDEQYQIARDLFINEDGIPYGATIYGMFLNLYVSNVLQFHPSVKHSHDALIENVTVHGLHHNVCSVYIRLSSLTHFTC